MKIINKASCKLIIYTGINIFLCFFLSLAYAKHDFFPENTPDLWRHTSNLLKNPSFEKGRSPWFSLENPAKPYWNDFEITREMSLSGSKSAVLRMSCSEEDIYTVGIWGLCIELNPDSFPKYISGGYYLKDWKRGTSLQYLQCVVMAFQDGEEFPEFPNIPIQIAYVLGGVDQTPVSIRNRKFVISGPLEPSTGQWLYFNFNLHDDFKRQWGRIPKKFDRVRVLFEARYDGLKEDENSVRATVYFDNLYMGNYKE